jgi:hypothetical protein
VTIVVLPAALDAFHDITRRHGESHGERVVGEERRQSEELEKRARFLFLRFLPFLTLPYFR